MLNSKFKGKLKRTSISNNTAKIYSSLYWTARRWFVRIVPDSVNLTSYYVYKINVSKFIGLVPKQTILCEFLQSLSAETYVILCNFFQLSCAIFCSNVHGSNYFNNSIKWLFTITSNFFYSATKRDSVTKIKSFKVLL